MAEFRAFIVNNWNQITRMYDSALYPLGEFIAEWESDDWDQIDIFTDVFFDLVTDIAEYNWKVIRAQHWRDAFHAAHVSFFHWKRRNATNVVDVCRVWLR